ncbi:MAG: hypothetical protein AABM43_11845 [Actinomycetota bacterium]
MTTTDAYGELLRIDRPVITTREAATRLQTTTSNASRRLRAMEKAGLVRHLRHGLWGLDNETDPFVLAPYLTAPFPAYVSLWSALARHGMIEQIPRQISVVSLDRARKVTTTIGTYSIHHLPPELFDGYRGLETSGYLATPEKALFDTVYVRAAGVRAGGGTRTFFPELLLPAAFDDAQLKQWIGRVNAPRLRTLVARGVREALRQASREGSSSRR